jgi:sortase A
MIRPLLITCFLAVGLWQIAGATSIHAKAWLGQVLLERAWNRSQDSDEPVAPWPGSVSHPIARIQVPALDIDHLVLEGADTPILAWGPGMEVGPNGHRLIAAHRDTHFRFLEKIEEGESVRLELANGVLETWQVVGRQVIDARATGLDMNAPGDRMTWVTCWPFDAIEAGGPMRLLVTLNRDFDIDRRPSSAASNHSGIDL